MVRLRSALADAGWVAANGSPVPRSDGIKRKLQACTRRGSLHPCGEVAKADASRDDGRDRQVTGVT